MTVRLPRVGVLLCVGILAGAVRSAGAPPPNDDCAAATVVPALPFADARSTVEATPEATDPRVCVNGGGPTVWYRFTPAASGTFCARSCGSDYDTVVAAIGGSCGGAIIGCNDDGCDSQSRLTFTGTAGLPVLLEVGRFGARTLPAQPGGYLAFTLAAAGADSDGDGVGDCADDCPAAANPAPQRDADGDGLGDVCDPCNAGLGHDLDGDGSCSDDDNCPALANATQLDTDGDHIGDACDACTRSGAVDVDHDGWCEDTQDNCPAAANPIQEDTDADHVGDACDRCPATPGTGTTDGDGDGRPDACDACPADPTDGCATLWGCRSGGALLAAVNMLVRLDPATGATSFVGPMDIRACDGLAFAPGTGQLYAVALSNLPGGTGFALYTVNTTTGAATLVGPLAGGGDFGDAAADVAFRADGTLFAHSWSTNRLATLDPQSGAVHDLGATGLTSFYGHGLAFDSQGTLFLADQAVLATLAPATGTATVVAPLSFPAACTFTPRWVDALAFDGGGTLFAALRCGAVEESRLATVDPTTGAVTIVGGSAHPFTALASEVCGNGTVEGGEACDDGNRIDGDCCSAACTAEPSGTACASDGNVCTVDACDAGCCAHRVPVTAGCTRPAGRRASIAVANGRLTWRWRGRGAPDFGSPMTTTALTLCLGDGAGNLLLTATAPAGDVCAGSPCWRRRRGGLGYADPEGTPDGIGTLRLRTGSAAGKVRIRLEAGGPNLRLAAPPYGTPLRARLVRDDDPATCWEATYASASRNDASRFRARRAREPAATTAAPAAGSE